MQGTLSDRLGTARRRLEAAGQGHVLRFVDELDEAQRERLLDQIDSVDWEEIGRLVESHVKREPQVKLPHDVQPAPWYPHRPTPDLASHYDKARATGEKLIGAGKVAAFTVAGGQGTRLGWDAPKGTFPATPVRGFPLFGCMAEYLLKAQDKYGGTIPWYIMTSPINDADTRAYLEERGYFGLDAGQVMIFPQQMMPGLDKDSGKVLLEDRGSIGLLPNGHGGSLKALHDRGAIADMKRRGVEQISYTQVDNPIVRMVDPLFIGLHVLDGAQMSSKMLPKAYPKEKLGNFCLVDGRVTVIEYSDLPDELAEQRLENGELRFRAGSIAIHVIGVGFLESLFTASGGAIALPYHRAVKKAAFIDLAAGRRIEPSQPNSVKLELFVFDALPLCEKSIIYEADRIDEFAPIKNADGPGAVDCPATSKAIQTERAARWLEARGVKIPRDGKGQVRATIEITQRTAIHPEDLVDLKDLPREVAADERVLL